MDLLVPMLAEPIPEKRIDDLLDSDLWRAEQKLDGVRLLVHVDNGKVTSVNRSGAPTASPNRAVTETFANLTSGAWAFDGELVGGVMWVFDMPIAGTAIGPDAPFEQRRAVLEAFMSRWDPGESVRLVESFRDSAEKRDLLARIRNHGGEGIMLKHIDAPYAPGKRTDKMRKVKLWKSCEVIITETRREGKDNAVMSMICPDRGLIEVGTVSRIGKGMVHEGDVVEVKYLYAVDPGRPRLYQPTILRRRTDKPMEECTIDQLSYTNKSVVTQ